MSARLQVTEFLVDSNRALETLRDEATKAYVRAEDIAKHYDRQGNGEDAEKWWALALRIKAWRERLFAEDLDSMIVDLVRDSAVLSA